MKKSNTVPVLGVMTSEQWNSQMEEVKLQDDPSFETFEPEKIIRPYGIGIDTHSRFIQVCVLFKEGDKILRSEKEFPTLWPHLISCRDWLHSLLTLKVPDFKPFQMHYCIESTGTYHCPIVRALGGLPSIVNPALAGSSKRKTDVLDAKMLAYQSITNLWRVSFFPTDELQNLRLLMGERRRWSHKRVDISNRMNNILLRFGHTPFSKAGFGTYTRPLIEDLADGKRPDVDTISNCVLPLETQKIFKELLLAWDTADSHVKKYTKEALRVALQMKFPVEGKLVSGETLMPFLQSVPAIGEISALTFLTEIYTVDRFPNSKAFSAYCGCDPSLKVSAGKVTSYNTRGGNRVMYSALIQAAGSLISRKGEPLGNWGYRIYSTNRKGGWKKATCAVARRLAVALYYVTKKCEPFSYDKYNYWREIEVPDIPISKMGFPTLVENKLRKLHLTTSKLIVEAYIKDLPRERGIGEKCLSEIQNWIQLCRKDYGSLARSSAEKGRKSPVKIWEKN